MRHRPRSPRLERLEDRRLLATLTVNTSSDLAPSLLLSLRDAINVVNNPASLSSLTPQQQAQVTGSLSDPDTIAFDIPGTGVQTIAPRQALPAITNPVTIDGYTQPGSSRNTLAVGDNAKILIELDGEFAGGNASGLVFQGANTSATNSGKTSAVVGLAINRFGTGGPSLYGVPSSGGNGVWFNGDFENDVVWGCFLGTDPTGTIGEPNSNYGVVFSLDHGTDSLGGTQADARNVVQVGDVGTLQQYGVRIEDENSPYVLNNYLGTNAAGTGVPTGQGVANATALSLADVNNAHIGGLVPGSGNVIQGISITSGLSKFQVLGSASGSSSKAPEIPGGTTPGFNHILGNLIGTDVTGKKAIGGGANFGGVTIVDSLSNTIGGSTPGAGNVIAAPGYNAISLNSSDPSTYLGTVVEGDHIGTDLTGTVNFGDAQNVTVLSSGNAIGDVVPGSGNVIAFSKAAGVSIQSASGIGNKVLANSIYGNAGAGIAVVSSGLTGTPSIGSACPVNTGLLIQGGTFTGGAASTPYTVEFFGNPAGTAQGRTFLSRLTVVTDATGKGNFGVLLPVGVSPGTIVTATVTGQTGNTTPFSPGVAVSAQPGDSITFSGSPVSSKFGNPVTFAATVTPSVSGVGLPTGDVIFKDGLTVLAVVKVDGSGKATFTTSTLGRRAHQLYAIYNGDPVFLGVRSAPVDVSVS